MDFQGSEIRAIRKALGLTQGELAALLGLTGTFIGLMERGEKPIEPRTIYAARYLADHPTIVSDAKAFAQRVRVEQALAG